MKKQGLSFLAAAVLCLATAAFALGQETTTTTKVTKTVQNPDGTYTVIEYPAKKEVMINLNPVKITGAKGVATILRDDGRSGLDVFRVLFAVGNVYASDQIRRHVLLGVAAPTKFPNASRSAPPSCPPPGRRSG